MLKKLFGFNKPTYQDLPHLFQQQIVEILKNDSGLTQSQRVILEDLIEAFRISVYDPEGIEILKDKLTEYFYDKLQIIYGKHF